MHFVVEYKEQKTKKRNQKLKEFNQVANFLEIIALLYKDLELE